MSECLERAIIQFDPADGKLVECNQTALSLLKLNNKSTIQDQLFTDLIPDESEFGLLINEQWDELFNEVRAQGSRSFQTEIKLPDNSHLPVDLVLSTNNSANQNMMVAELHPLSGNGRAPDFLEEICTLSEQVCKETSFDDALALALRKIIKMGGWNYGEVWTQINDDFYNLVQSYNHNAPNTLASSPSFTEISLDELLPRSLNIQSAPLWITDPDIFNGYNLEEIIEKKAFNTILILPVFYKNKIRALLFFFSEEISCCDFRTYKLAIKTVTAQLNLLYRSMGVSFDDRRTRSPLIKREAQNHVLNRHIHLDRKVLDAKPRYRSQNQEKIFKYENYYKKRLYDVRRLKKLNGQPKKKSLQTAYPEVGDRNNNNSEIHSYFQPSLDGNISKFLANFSHELRTSLNSIALLSKLLMENRKGNLDDHQIDNASSIYYSSNGLLEFTNNILDISKYQSGKLGLNVEAVSLESIRDKLNNIYKPIAHERGISFECRINSNVPDLIATDRIRLEQILKNLISNAFKFTSEGGITTLIERPGSLELRGQNLQADDCLAFRVQDTGIGIPRDKQKFIFDSFSQADETTQSQYGGTGLGLTICRDFAELLGGNIGLESKAGAGSTFSVYVPSRHDDLAEQDSTSGEVPNNEANTLFETNISGNQPMDQSSPPVTDKTILLVDDSELHSAALREFLNFKYAHCLMATTARETYKVLSNQKVNCIVLDMHLPDADGYEVIKQIKERFPDQNIPVIIYTGKNMSKAEVSELEQHADAIVEKSIGSYKIVIESIATLLDEAKV